jgi:acetolactate synthase-1/3 small subunit
MRHTLVAWVEDRPGVLARIAGMFRRRAFNIVSLIVGRSERPGLSRMTIVVETDRLGAELVEANLLKLIDVVDVHDITHKPAVRHELAFVKVKADSTGRLEIAQLAEIFRAKIVDVSLASVIVEVSGDEEKIDRLIDVLRPKGVLEVMRTGCVAMSRGDEALADESSSEPAAPAKPAAA